MVADNRTIKELSASGLDNTAPLCTQYPLAALGKTDEFELKSSLLHHIPKFHRMSMEDPNKHLKEFEVVCSSMTPVNVDGSILKMNDFPFSFLEKAKDWLYELAPGTITSWESESFPTYYERFKTLVASCPQHQMKEELLLQYFYEGLLPIERQMLDTSAGGALVDKTLMAANTLIANRALNVQQYEGVGQRDTSRQQVNEMAEGMRMKEPNVRETIQISSGGSPNNPNNKEALGSNLRASIPSNTHQHKPHNNLPKTPQGQENQAKAMQNQDKKVDQMEKQIGQITEFVGQFREQELIIEEEGQSTPTARVETSLPQAPKASKPSNSANKGKEVPILINSNVVPPNVPFPRRFMQSKNEEAKKDILETFRKVQVNIPLLDTIKQVPRYAKFLKELCTTRKRISSKKVVKRKLPTKCKDPGSFTIPYVIGNTHFESAMLDLGASINVMPYSIYASMHLGELKKDGVIIQLVDRSNAYPNGVLKDVLVQDHFEQLNDDTLELVIARGMDIQNNEAVTMHPHGMNDFSLTMPPNEDVIGMVAALESLPLQFGKFLDPISISVSANKLLPSIMQPPTLELKPLPSHLKYIFLGDDETLPVIISSTLTTQEEDKLVRVLREYKTAIGWTLDDIKGISPTTCMHRILLDEGSKTSREAQRQLNPLMMEVVKKEIIKLLDYGVIYPISDSRWVSPVQYVPKKSGVTVVTNAKN
ncbi:unnamed protein product [Malus baccata var. baccata]